MSKLIRLLTALIISLPVSTFAVDENIEPKNKQRIVALAPHIVETLFELGVGEQIIATLDYADFPKAALEIPRVGGYYGINIEKIVALQPDLILAWKGGNREEDLSRLEQLGLNLHYSQPKDIEGVAAELRYFGRLTNRQARGEQLAKKFEAELNQIRHGYSNKTPVDTFYQLWSQPMMTVNKRTWIHQLLTSCGANNVFAQNPTDYPQISIENVIVAKPQLIIMPQEKADKPQPKIDWAQWQIIPAVTHNQFKEVDADLIHRFSRRMLVGLKDMCQKIDLTRRFYATSKISE